MSAVVLALAAILLAAQTSPAAPAPARTPSAAQAGAAPSAAPSGAPSAAAYRPRYHSYGRLLLSPKGDRVAALEAVPGPAGVDTAIVIRSAADGTILRTIALATSPTGMAFSPSGNLAWIVAGQQQGTAAIVVDDGARQRTIATVKGLVQSLSFSPGGDRIAALVVLNPTKETGATQAGARQIGEIGETSDEQRLAIFPVAGGVDGAAVTPDQVVPVSPADRYIYEYDWTPDGAGFVVTSAPGNGDNNWWVATLDHVDPATGMVRNIARPATQLNFPRVSPDGGSVAFIGGLMSDFGSIGGDVWTVPIAGGTPTDVTRGAPMTFVSLAWTRGGLRAVALHNDKMEIVALAPVKGGPVKGAPVKGTGNDVMLIGYSQPVSLAAGDGRASFAADGTAVAMVAEDFTHAPAIYAGRSVTPVQITHDNDAVPPAVAARSVTWRSDGFNVQGWLLSPLGADPAVKAPMIVQVHGGPSAASSPRFITRGPATEYLDAGYYLFSPNPRGSYGQGEAFTAANRRDFGGGDLRDILAGVDAAEKVAPIDDDRLGLTGCSYGGFMAMWANTRTNRFKAIVAGAGLSNMVSYYGTNGIDQWLIPFYGKSVYDDYKIYEDASAVYHVKTAKTPTFIYVGERDIEVPPTQSVEWWHALKAQGVDTSLVIYPDAGHCVPRPDQNADVRKRALAWFGKYLGK